MVGEMLIVVQQNNKAQLRCCGCPMREDFDAQRLCCDICDGELPVDEAIRWLKAAQAGVSALRDQLKAEM